MTKHDLLSSATAPITLRVLPELAQEIGLNASLVLLQLTYWIRIANHEHDGRYWTYQSLRDMQRKAFPFWSHMTIQRAIERLIALDLITTRDDLNQLKQDHTRWFALNPDALAKLNSITLQELRTKERSQPSQTVTGLEQDVTASSQFVTTLPEITPQTTQKERSAPSAVSDELPDHLTPAQRKVIQLPDVPRPQPDGGAAAFTITEAYLNEWNVVVKKFRDAIHRDDKKHAIRLAELGATPDEVAAMCRERRAKGHQMSDFPLAFAARDYVTWKMKQETAAPAARVLSDSERAVQEAALEAERRAWQEAQGLV